MYIGAVLTENESSFVENIPHTPEPLGTVPNLVYLSTPRGEGLQRSRLAHLASPSTQAGRLQPATHVLISHCGTGYWIVSIQYHLIFSLSIQYHLLASSFSLNDRAT